MTSFLLKAVCAATLMAATTVSAQVHKCTGADGKITFTEAACNTTSKSIQAVNIPLSTYQAPELRAQTMAESKDRAAADRLKTVQLMLSNGKVAEARLYARTPEERAMVAHVESANAVQRKEARQAKSDADLKESGERLRKALKR